MPDTVLNVVAENKGEMIAIGGGGIVRDMIQRAHNMNLGINLMNGPEGASTEKATIMQEYAFEGAKGLIKKLYKRHPDIFVENFDIKHLNQYVEKAKNEQQMAVHINELKSQVSQKNIDQKVKKTYIKPQMFIKDMNNLTL